MIPSRTFQLATDVVKSIEFINEATKNNLGASGYTYLSDLQQLRVLSTTINKHLQDAANEFQKVTDRIDHYINEEVKPIK